MSVSILRVVCAVICFTLGLTAMACLAALTAGMGHLLGTALAAHSGINLAVVLALCGVFFSPIVIGWFAAANGITHWHDM